LSLLFCWVHSTSADAQYLSDVNNDHIFSAFAYDVIEVLEPGETLPIQVLYDTEAQKNALFHEYGNDPDLEISKEEIYWFARKQFELGAILVIGDKDGRRLIPSEQNIFILRNQHTLQQVSAAMNDGRYVPYMRDMKLVHDSFEVLKSWNK